MLLNCGGVVDIQEHLTVQEETQVYILDSHRPLSLHNIYASQNIKVLDDGDMDHELEEPFFALEVCFALETK